MELADMPLGFWIMMFLLCGFMAGVIGISCAVKTGPADPAAEIRMVSAVVQDTTERLEKLNKTVEDLTATIDALNIVMDGATEKNLADLEAATKKLDQSIEALKAPPKETP
jgi:peptidoglycan hydrolase CwlO-like protein